MLESLERRRLLSDGTSGAGLLTVRGGKLDLANNTVIISNGGIVGLVNPTTSGNWDGSGIITTQTDAIASSLLNTLAIANASDVLGLAGAQTTFWSGQTIAATDTLVMYTYAGDANLSGDVDGDDYFIIDRNYYNSQVPAGWWTGDFGVSAVGPLADVSATAKSDRILVYERDGAPYVSINGKEAPVSSTELRIHANAGNDVVSIELSANFSNLRMTIYGGAGDDTIFAGVGNDRIFAGDGNDLVRGGNGNDTVYGEAGDDSLRGGNSGDLLDGGDGNDTVRGDFGNDNCSGGAGVDRLRGSAGDDRLYGGSSKDFLAGESGNDSLSGDGGGDILSGGDGDDDLLGGAGDDQLSGDAGEDNFLGGSGHDAYAGGSDADAFGDKSESESITDPAGLEFVPVSQWFVEGGRMREVWELPGD